MTKNFKKLKEHLLQFHPITETEWKFMKTRFSFKKVDKNEYLTQPSSIENYIYFIIKGIVAVVLETEEKTHIIDFRFSNNFVSSYTSFITRKPSCFGLETLTDCEFLVISYSAWEETITQTTFGNHLSRKITEHNLIEKEAKEINNYTKSPTELYLDLIKNKPEIIENIPLNQIASYLGITAPALSRIRKKNNLK